jgi:hypothetical protein
MVGPVLAAATSLNDRPGCRRCAVAPMRNQLRLFESNADGGVYAGSHDTAVVRSDEGPGWPPTETSSCGRLGFWRERTLNVFGSRAGVGPLLIMPDTSILIAIRDQLDQVEEAAGLIGNPLWSARDEPVDALRDLVQLWWWRDVRFVVSPIHLVDSRKPLSEVRQRAREAAVRELDRDYFERGGAEVVVGNDVHLDDEPCALHAIPPATLSSGSLEAGKWRWPRGVRDRQLTQAAYDEGCHVFLTTDDDILRSHVSLFPRGLAILSPTRLLEELDESGELDVNTGGDFLFPDLSTLSRLYAGFGDTVTGRMRPPVDRSAAATTTRAFV